MKKDCPLVSIIIPVYNVAPYLREALDSVVNQTYENLEIIVVDDGSTDGSGDICDEYCSDSRAVVIHQVNRGVSAARNSGLDRATGDYIAFLDSDDAYYPDFIKRMLVAIENADVAECQFTRHQLDLSSHGEPVLMVKEGYYDRVQVLRALLDGRLPPCVNNKLYRRKLWNEIRFREGHFYEDWDVLFRIYDLIHRLYFLEQPLAFRRIRPGSTTQSNSCKLAEDWKLMGDQIISFVESHIPDVFDETHLAKIQQVQMNRVIAYYIQGYMDIEEVKTICRKVDPTRLSFKSRMVYQMICCCPWLLKAIYPIYKSSRMLAQKVFYDNG